MQEHSLDSNVEADFQEVDLGSRVDGPFRTTFHVYKSPIRIGYYLERIFNEHGKLVRMIKRTSEGRSETRFCPNSGDVVLIFESYTIPDGNILTKEKRYLDGEAWEESVLVVDPLGNLVRTVIREGDGVHNLFTGQTEYENGGAKLTVSHWFDRQSGKMNVREQVQWLENGDRGVSELFSFTADGVLVKYHKRLYHPSSDRHLEELHLYEPRSQALLRKEIKTYGSSDDSATIEITIFDTKGNVLDRKTTFTTRVR